MRQREVIDDLQQAAPCRVGMSVQQAPATDANARKLVAQIRGALKNEERKLEEALPHRIAAILTTALALGVVIGWAVRKRP